MKVVRDKNFIEEVIESEVPVLMEFWSMECIICQKADKDLVELEEAYKDKLKVVRFDVEGGSPILKNYGVKSIPWFILFKGGKEMANRRGYGHLMEIERMVRGHI